MPSTLTGFNNSSLKTALEEFKTYLDAEINQAQAYSEQEAKLLNTLQKGLNLFHTELAPFLTHSCDKNKCTSNNCKESSFSAEELYRISDIKKKLGDLFPKPEEMAIYTDQGAQFLETFLEQYLTPAEAAWEALCPLMVKKIPTKKTLTNFVIVLFLEKEMGEKLFKACSDAQSLATFIKETYFAPLKQEIQKTLAVYHDRKNKPIETTAQTLPTQEDQQTVVNIKEELETLLKTIEQKQQALTNLHQTLDALENSREERQTTIANYQRIQALLQEAGQKDSLYKTLFKRIDNIIPLNRLLTELHYTEESLKKWTTYRENEEGLIPSFVYKKTRQSKMDGLRNTLEIQLTQLQKLENDRNELINSREQLAATLAADEVKKTELETLIHAQKESEKAKTLPKTDKINEKQLQNLIEQLKQLSSVPDLSALSQQLEQYKTETSAPAGNDPKILSTILTLQSQGNTLLSKLFNRIYFTVLHEQIYLPVTEPMDENPISKLLQDYKKSDSDFKRKLATQIEKLYSQLETMKRQKDTLKEEAERAELIQTIQNIQIELDKLVLYVNHHLQNQTKQELLKDEFINHIYHKLINILNSKKDKFLHPTYPLKHHFANILLIVTSIFALFIPLAIRLTYTYYTTGRCTVFFKADEADSNPIKKGLDALKLEAKDIFTNKIITP